jgi:hypothetical protein
MPKYRAYVTATKYRAFEFEADDDVLAWDHMETLLSNYSNDHDRFLAMAEESGPDEMFIDELEEI